MKKTASKTDWKRVLAHQEGVRIPFASEDGPYDPNDAEAARAWLQNADVTRKGKVVRRGKRGPQKAPTKKLVSLRLSPEVVDHFKATGPGWQTRIDTTLLKSIKKRA
ncbi:MAG TPA: BrnA antitoxin family protein [Terracidiphilus sp.]|nr:BrnA antitoxin family protein [Terracidiphilus sp.]